MEIKTSAEIEWWIFNGSSKRTPELQKEMEETRWAQIDGEQELLEQLTYIVEHAHDVRFELKRLIDDIPKVRK